MGVSQIVWNLKLIFQRNKGFTLIELVLALGLSSILILSISSLLRFSKHVSVLSNEIDELMLNGRYAIEYIKDEVKSAEKIIPSSKISGLNGYYRENVGFVIVNKEDEIFNRFTTYYRKDDKLIRISGLAKNNTYPIYSQLQGHNEISEFIHSIKGTSLDIENKMIYLDFQLLSDSGQELNLKANYYVRCPIDN